MRQGQRSISVNFRPYFRQILWHELGMVSLLLMELAWVLPWFRAITPTIQAGRNQSSLLAFLIFFVIVTYVNRILRTIDMQSITHRIILVLVLLLGLYSLSRTLIYPGLGLSFGEFIKRTVISLENILNNIPEGFFVLLMGMYLWWRGIAISSSGTLDIQATERKFRFGILMLGVFGIIFRGTKVAFLLNVLPLYFASGLLVVTFSRTSSLGRGITAFRLPYTGSWFMGMMALTAFTILMGFFLGQVLQSEAANVVYDFFSRSFEQLLILLQVLLLPVIEVLVSIVEKIMEFLSRFIDPESLNGITDQIQVQPTPIFPFEQGDSILEIPPVVMFLIVLLILLVLVILIVRRANRHSLYGVPAIDDEGETVFEPEEIRSRIKRFLNQVRESVDLIRKFGMGHRMHAATVIRRVYTHLLNLSADLGRPRHSAETPYEFQQKLFGLFPDQIEQVGLITNAYVHVRYGEIPEEENIIAMVEAAWESIEKDAKRISRRIRA